LRAHTCAGLGRSETPAPATCDELARLREAVEMLQQQMREVMERLQRLEAK
jgi:hypothetical protein